jgi:hypothetical protein
VRGTEIRASTWQALPAHAVAPLTPLVLGAKAKEDKNEKNDLHFVSLVSVGCRLL